MPIGGICAEVVNFVDILTDLQYRAVTDTCAIAGESHVDIVRRIEGYRRKRWMWTRGETGVRCRVPFCQRRGLQLVDAAPEGVTETAVFESSVDVACFVEDYAAGWIFTEGFRTGEGADYLRRQ